MATARVETGVVIAEVAECMIKCSGEMVAGSSVRNANCQVREDSRVRWQKGKNSSSFYLLTGILPGIIQGRSVPKVARGPPWVRTIRRYTGVTNNTWMKRVNNFWSRDLLI